MVKEMGREGKRRGRGKGKKGKGWSRERGKVTEGMGGTGQDMGWDGERRQREGRRGATAPNFNSWHCHC